MPRSLRFRRLKALALLSCFLGGGTSLPGLDALLYHWRASDQPAGQWHQVLESL